MSNLFKRIKSTLQSVFSFFLIIFIFLASVFLLALIINLSNNEKPVVPTADNDYWKEVPAPLERQDVSCWVQAGGMQTAGQGQIVCLTNIAK